MIISAGLRPNLSVAYCRNCKVRQARQKSFLAHNLANCLAGRLDSTPGRDIFPCNNGRPGTGELLDEAFVRDDTAVQVDFFAQRQ